MSSLHTERCGGIFTVTMKQPETRDAPTGDTAEQESVPGNGGAWRLPRAVGRAKATQTPFRDEAIAARNTLACGLTIRVVRAEQWIPTARALTERIAAPHGGAIRITKKPWRDGEHATVASLLEAARRLLTRKSTTAAR